MKITLIILFIFILQFAGLEYVARRVYPERSKITYKFDRFENESQKIELMFLGTCMLAHAINPVGFGVRAYNVSYPDLSEYMQLELIDRVTKKKNNLKYVVIELNFLTLFYAVEKSSTYKVLAPLFYSRYEVKSKQDNWFKFMLNYSMFYSTKDFIFNHLINLYPDYSIIDPIFPYEIDRNMKVDIKADSDIITSNGYILNTLFLNKERLNEEKMFYNEVFFKKFINDDLNISFYSKILKRLKSLNIIPVVLNPPLHEHFTKLLKENNPEKFKKYLIFLSKIKKMKNVFYYSDELFDNTNNKLFVDFHQLNVYGAKLYTDKFRSFFIKKILKQ